MEIITTHFLHGYVPRKEFKNKEPSIRGGLFGGHIYIQLKNHVYGFEPLSNNDFHILPRRSHHKFNSVLKKENYEEWMLFANDKKLTSIDINITSPRYRYLKNLLKRYKKVAPFDYALFGVRCASFTHFLLTKAQVCNSSGVLDSIIRYPYPRKLRKKLIHKAAKYGWKVTKKEGKETRIWENDDFFLKTLLKPLGS